jgi:peptidyl-Lys metalloendopeptidase
MFSSYLRASLAALVASAITASAAPSLTVKTSTPNAIVDGLGNLKVTATITNTGDETLKLLNDPRGVLNKFPENSFNITDATGSRPSFNGAKVNHASGHLTSMCAQVFGFRFQVKYSPTYAASLDKPSVFTVLAPGASVNVIHDREWDRFWLGYYRYLTHNHPSLRRV